MEKDTPIQGVQGLREPGNHVVPPKSTKRCGDGGVCHRCTDILLLDHHPLG